MYEFISTNQKTYFGKTGGEENAHSRLEIHRKREDRFMRYYVAVDGSDTNPGTAEAPFATLCRARDEVRKQIRRGLSDPVTVKILEGVYRTDNLLLTEEDSGTAAFPVTYEAQGNVVLSGGMKLRADMFEALTDEEKSRLRAEAAENVVRADLKKLGLCRRDWGEMCVTGSHHTGDRYDGAVLSPMWCELFADDVRQTVARYPNEGFLYTEVPFREGNGRESTVTGKIQYRYTPEQWENIRNPLSDIYRLDPVTAKRAALWKTLNDVWMFGYPAWNWADMSTPVVRVDEKTCAMETKMVSLYGMKAGAPYYFYNVFEELDSPGEWYLDRENGILYWYAPVPLAQADIMLSLSTESIVTMRDVSYVTLKGITFTGTRADALRLSGDHLTVRECTVKNVAGHAMVIRGENNLVCGCEICHVGQGGVTLCGGDRATLTPARNIAEHNHVHHFAEIFKNYRPAFRLEGVGNVCRHNCIHDSSHMAIGFAGNEHLIEYNEIYAVCKTSDDAAAVYSGRDYSTQGTVIRFNFFHDIVSAAKKNVGIFAVYCDDNLGKCTIVQNVFVRCQSALLLHGGHNMTFAGNLIMDAPENARSALTFHKYHCWWDLLGDSLHAKRLREVPWQSAIWKKAYPQIEKYLSWDIETEQRFPHFANISGNVIICHRQIEINFEWDNPLFENKVENNTVLEEKPRCDLGTLCEVWLPEHVSGFAPIPFSRIGRKETV